MEPKVYLYVRFSTSKQVDGDSERRQEAYAETYAKDHDITLDESLKLYDRATSGYHGKHRISGALGVFLKLVDTGEISSGSVLLVENLDRLSREQPFDALWQFMSLIRAGIKIVTTQENNEKEYTRENINEHIEDLDKSFGEIKRAYSESKTKSDRISKAYQEKRNAIGKDFKLTSKCPSWLEPIGVHVSPTKFKVSDYRVIPEAVAVIKEIFRLKLEKSYGSEKIARELNKKGVWKPPGRISRNPEKQSLPASWRKSYVDKILRNNRAVLGEYQPHKMVNGKRTPVGDPQKEYFPQIIDEDTFNEVQNLFEPYDETKKHAGGRNGNVTNLFRDMAYCSRCGFPIQHVNKGNPSQGWRYMACDKELRQVTGGCAKNRIRYQIIEDNILTYCEGLNVSDILPDSKQSQSELAALQKQLQARKGELKAKNYPKKIEHLEETIGDTQGREARRNLANRLQQHIEDQKSFEVQIQEIEAKITEHTKSKKGIEEQIKDVKELIVKMRELEGDERIELRLKLRIQLRGLIKRIVIHLDRNLLVIFFRSGQRRGIDLLTSEITIDSFPKSAGFIETDNGYIKKQ